MEVAVDLQKVDNLLRLLAHVAYRRRCGRVRQIRVEQQIHLERSEISVDELKQWRPETGDRLRGEVVVFRQRVVFGVEDHVEDLAGEQVLDLRLRQSHCLSPVCVNLVFRRGFAPKAPKARNMKARGKRRTT